MNFTAGQQLKARSICDHDCIFEGEVVSRTAKTATIRINGEAKRCKIHVDDDGVEFVYPLGRYSMAPVFSAAQ